MTRALLCLALVACGASARHTTLAVTMAALDTAETSFVAYDGQHQLNIVADCATEADCKVKLGTYRSARDKAVLDITAGYRAVAAAYQLDTDPSVAAAIAAAMAVKKALVALGMDI